MPKHPGKAVIYARVSRKRDDQYSTGDQVAAAKAYCFSQGATVVDVIVEEGQSAFKKKRRSRPGFRKAMQLIESGAADMFVVWKLDRACRDTIDLLELLRDDLQPYDAKFVSVTEDFNTSTPIGRAMLTIIGALAEMESAQKRERAFSYHDGRRKRGVPPAGKAPFGYKRVSKHKFKIEPKSAGLLREAADRLIAGESVNSIVRWMNDPDHVLSRPGLLGAFQSPTIAALVSSEPLEVRGGVKVVPESAELSEGEWEPVLERGVWDEVRAILNDPNRRSKHGNKLAHPLVPVIRCACGGRMGVMVEKRGKSGPRERYVCRNAGNPNTTSKCQNGITRKQVDAEVIAAVLDHLDDAKWRSLRSSGTTTGPDPADVEAKLERMKDMVKAGDIEPEEYAEFKAHWMGELKAAASEPVDLPDVDSLRGSWDGLTVMEQHVVFRRAIKSLVIGPATRRGPVVDMERVDLDLND